MVEIIILLGVILLSMTVHEAMHAFMGFWLGDDTAKREGRLTLNPIAHIDPFMTLLLPLVLFLSGGPIFGGAKPVPFNPSRVKYGEFGAMLVGIVGPFTNLVIAFLAFGLHAIISGEGSFGEILKTAVYVNLGFFIFNMLPIPPLDGSRLLYYLAPDSARRVMQSLEQYGIFIILALVLLLGPLLGNFMIASIEFFVNIFASIFDAVL